MLKKNNLNFEIICVVALIFFLLNKLEEFFTFIVTQMYNLVANNLDINTSRTFFTKNNNKLVLFDTISIDTRLIALSRLIEFESINWLESWRFESIRLKSLDKSISKIKIEIRIRFESISRVEIETQFEKSIRIVKR